MATVPTYPRVIALADMPVGVLDLNDLGSTLRPDYIIIAETGQFGVLGIRDGKVVSGVLGTATLPASTGADAGKVAVATAEGDYDLVASLSTAVIPNLSAAKITSGQLAVAQGGTGVTTLTALRAALGIRAGSVVFAGDTSKAVVLSSALPDANYQVGLSVDANIAVAPWVTAKTTTGFTINVALGLTDTVGYLVLPNT